MKQDALNELGRLIQRANRGAMIAQEWSNNLQPTTGTIVDVKDPLNLGRIKVILDEVNPDILTEKGFNQGAAQATITDWIEPLVPFAGLQPEKLVGARVPVTGKAGDPNRLTFGDPTFDPSETGSAKQPQNSSMTRLPVYPTGGLPEASADNVGCMVIEQDGPMNCDWLCVCLKRRGEYYWVRHVDLAHGHAGQDDSDPAAENVVEPPDLPPEEARAWTKQLAIWDFVFPTTDKEYPKTNYETIYGTDPRFPYDPGKQPYEPDSNWHGGA